MVAATYSQAASAAAAPQQQIEDTLFGVSQMADQLVSGQIIAGEDASETEIRGR